MRQRRSNLEKVRDEPRALAAIHLTESRPTVVLVPMHMKHSDVSVVRDLQCCPDSIRVHHGPDTRVINIVLIGDGMVRITEEQKSIRTKGRSSTSDESDSLGCKLVRSGKISMNLGKQHLRNFESYLHRRALRCAERICTGAKLAGTLFQDQVCHDRDRMLCVVQFWPRCGIGSAKNSRVV